MLLPRCSWRQQVVMVIALSLSCGIYFWCTAYIKTRVLQQTEQEYYLHKARTLCTALAPDLQWQASFATTRMNGTRYWSMSGYVRGHELLNMRWNIVTDQLVNVGVPDSETAQSVVIGADAPIRTQAQAIRRSQELLRKLGQTRWLFVATAMGKPQRQHGIWTLFYREGSQRAMMKLVAKQGGLRYFGVLDYIGLPLLHGNVPGGLNR